MKRTVEVASSHAGFNCSLGDIYYRQNTLSALYTRIIILLAISVEVPLMTK